jgi:DNA topoisomerase-1
MSTGEEVLAALTTEDHHTTPPRRLTEAGLVKALEESGIGRPSTYASIIDTIERREYTFRKGNALVPTFTAFAVVKLMSEHLEHLIDIDFTARMEDRLDGISRGEHEPLPYLKEFYFGNGMPGLKSLIEDKVEEIDARQVCSIPLGVDDEGRDIVVRVGRYGPFLQRGDLTANVPDKICPDELDIERATALIEEAQKGDEPIGTHPESGLPVYVKLGRYGPYVQLGDPDPDSKTKPKMVSLLKGMSAPEVSLDVAVELLKLPKVVGQDPDGEDIVVHLGRYGPYIKRGTDTRSLTDDDSVLDLPLARALELLAQEKRRGRAAASQIKIFENVEQFGGASIKLLAGRYGPYVTDGEINASLPRDMTEPAELSLQQALDLLARRRDNPPVKRKKKAKTKTKKKAKKKTSKKKAKKKTSKKKGSKKTSKKKVPENA